MNLLRTCLLLLIFSAPFHARAQSGSHEGNLSGDLPNYLGHYKLDELSVNSIECPGDLSILREGKWFAIFSVGSASYPSFNFKEDSINQGWTGWNDRDAVEKRSLRSHDKVRVISAGELVIDHRSGSNWGWSRGKALGTFKEKLTLVQHAGKISYQYVRREKDHDVEFSCSYN